MNAPSLKNKLIKAISHGVNVTLITQDVSNDPIALVAYENVELLLYRGKSLKESTIIIDSDFVCIQKGGLGDSKTTFFCSDAPLLLQKTLKTIHPIHTHSKPYLE